MNDQEDVQSQLNIENVLDCIQPLNNDTTSASQLKVEEQPTAPLLASILEQHRLLRILLM